MQCSLIREATCSHVQCGLTRDLPVPELVARVLVLDGRGGEFYLAFLQARELVRHVKGWKPLWSSVNKVRMPL